MERLNKKLTLTDITRYDDVEMGTLKLTVDGRQKCWKAIWQTNLRVNIQGLHGLPSGVLPLELRPYRRWMDCPRLKLSQRIRMWLVPLESNKWYDFGVDLYLCDDSEAIVPLSKEGYRQLRGAIWQYDIRELTVEEPRWTVDGDRLCHDQGVSFDADFWKESDAKSISTIKNE